MTLARALALYGQGSRVIADGPSRLTGFERSIQLLDVLLSESPGYRPAVMLRALAHGGHAEALREAARSTTESAERVRLNGLSRQQYVAMKADLDLLVMTFKDVDSVVRLLDAMACLKVAGPPPRAETQPAGTQPAASPDEPELRSEPVEAARLLLESVRLLDAYLKPAEGAEPPSAENRVRGLMFKGVAQFRRAAFLREVIKTARGADRSRVAADAKQSLQDARATFAELVGAAPTVLADAPTLNKWQSYGYFYLGLTQVESASQVSGAPSEYAKMLRAAADSLRNARKFDVAPGYSLSGGTIEGFANTMVGSGTEDSGGMIGEQLDKMKTAERPPFSDFRVDWRSGFFYDTNVILLGDNTDLPRGIGRKNDFRFLTGVTLNYTTSLAALAGQTEDSELGRWTLGMAGRVGASWHASIKEFNEQNYGASVALQYRLIDKNTETKHGPLYAGIQYDYDYFLLGNDGFLRMSRISPRLTLYTFDERAVTVLGFNYEDRNYLDTLFDDRFDRDGNYYYINLTQSVDLIDMTKLYNDAGIAPWGLENDPNETDYPYEYTRYLRPYFGFEYGWDVTRGNEFDNERFQVVGGVNVPLPYGLLFDFRGQWEYQDYKGFRGGSLADFHRRARRDLVQRYGFGLERTFVLVPGEPVNRSTLKMDRVTMTLRGDIVWTNDDSNVQDRLRQAVFSYDRTIYGLSVILSFN